MWPLMRVYTVCQQFLDKLTDSEMDLFKFYDKYGKEYLNVRLNEVILCIFS